MPTLTFYTDPLCPWAWRTALWAIEVRKMRQLTIDWKLFSLTEVHRSADTPAEDQPPTDITLRTLIQARRVGGNDAVERLYLALGRARHERRENLKSEDVLAAALEQAGLSVSLLADALGNPSTESDLLSEHRDSVERLGAFGVPWLVLDQRSFGLFGPVITEVPEGQAAAELWDHTAWFLTQPSFFELKRDRP